MIKHGCSDHLGAAADSVSTPLQYLEQNRCLYLIRWTQTGRATLASSSEILLAVLPFYLLRWMTTNYKQTTFLAAADIHTRTENRLPPLIFKIRSCETSLIKRRCKWYSTVQHSTGSLNINFTEQALSITFLGSLCSLFTTRRPMYTSFILQETNNYIQEAYVQKQVHQFLTTT